MPSEEHGSREISSVFEQCSSCGTCVVSLSQHRCTPETSDTRPDRSERQRLAAEDERDDATEVGIFPNTRGNRYAYHDVDDWGRPRCGCGKHTDASSASVVTIAEAKRYDRSPCGSCRWIRRRTGDGDDQQ